MVAKHEQITFDHDNVQLASYKCSCEYICRHNHRADYTDSTLHLTYNKLYIYYKQKVPNGPFSHSWSQMYMCCAQIIDSLVPRPSLLCVQHKKEGTEMAWGRDWITL